MGDKDKHLKKNGDLRDQKDQARLQFVANDAAHRMQEICRSFREDKQQFVLGSNHHVLGASKKSLNLRSKFRSSKRTLVYFFSKLTGTGAAVLE